MTETNQVPAASGAHQRKRRKFDPAERRHHDRLESLGLLALADEALILPPKELGRRLEELADSGHLADFVDLARELEQQNDLMAKDLAEDNPSQAAYGREQARSWRRLRRRISRRPSPDAPKAGTSRPRAAPRSRRTANRSEDSASGGPIAGAGGDDPPGPRPETTSERGGAEAPPWSELVAQLHSLKNEIAGLRADLEKRTPPEIFSADQAADYLGVSRRTVERLIEGAVIRARRIRTKGERGVVRIARAALDAYVAG